MCVIIRLSIFKGFLDPRRLLNFVLFLSFVARTADRREKHPAKISTNRTCTHSISIAQNLLMLFSCNMCYSAYTVRYLKCSPNKTLETKKNIDRDARGKNRGNVTTTRRRKMRIFDGQNKIRDFFPQRKSQKGGRDYYDAVNKFDLR